jgi:deazaflavin-dependent oxidoreductase (nitroreductase family)
MLRPRARNDQQRDEDRTFHGAHNDRMNQFSGDVLEAAAREREVKLTTYGRKTGKPRRVTIWIGTDGKRLYIRSGEGMRRHWPQNLLAKGEGVVRLGKTEVKVRPRLVTDPEEARAVSDFYRSKYGPFVRPSELGQPLTLGEQTTFELAPA